MAKIKISVTKKMVSEIKSQAKNSYDDETVALCKSWVKQKTDIDFLVARNMKAGSLSFSAGRETGISSNSIVAIAYGKQKLNQQQMPSDHSDLKACQCMWGKLPKHRKTKDAIQAMTRAVIHIDRKYPGTLTESEEG